MKRTTLSTVCKPRNGVLALSGYGIQVGVESGHLCIEDGIAGERRRGRFPRVERELKRVVILGRSGSITFDALRWMQDVGISFVQLGSDGQLVATSGRSGFNDARLRRAQATAIENGIGLRISQMLIHQKLIGQLEILKRFREGEAIKFVGEIVKQIENSESTDELRWLESRAANQYWKAWRDIQIVFVERDSDKIPEHWHTFGTRSSLISSPSARRASNPINAILNYLYSILESESRIAALAVGLDPGIGLMHSDLRSRDSLACDVMEPIRPSVDKFVLELLEKRAFRKSEFFETSQGNCRIMPPLTKSFAETAQRWKLQIAPITEKVAALLFSDTEKKSKNKLPTPLTESQRSAGRAKYRQRYASVSEVD